MGHGDTGTDEDRDTTEQDRPGDLLDDTARTDEARYPVPPAPRRTVPPHPPQGGPRTGPWQAPGPRTPGTGPQPHVPSQWGPRPGPYGPQGPHGPQGWHQGTPPRGTAAPQPWSATGSGYGWPASPDDDAEEVRPAGNGAAVTSCVFAILGLLLSLRPLFFGSNAMSIDTFVALGLAVVGLVAGIAATRIPRRRAATIIGIALSLLALLVIAVIPTL
jgi:hypothetical protein